jgi:hypothetical protein
VPAMTCCIFLKYVSKSGELKIFRFLISKEREKESLHNNSENDIYESY